MFWNKKPSSKPSKPTRDEIMAQAKANAKKASDEIGNETLQQIKAALLKKQSCPIEKAKAQLRAVDADKARIHLSYMMREEK